LYGRTVEIFGKKKEKGKVAKPSTGKEKEERLLGGAEIRGLPTRGLTINKQLGGGAKRNK